MIVFKLIAPVLTLLFIALQITLDYKWHDKRTKIHRRVRRALLYILGITAIVTIVIVVGDSKDAKRMQDRLNNLQATLDKERFDAQKREAEAKKDRAILLKRLNEIHFENVLSDTFKPLASDVYQIAVKSLKSFLSEEVGSKVSIFVDSQSGDRNRQLLAQEFVKILKDAGADVQGPQFQVTFSNAVLPAIRIKINPTDEQLAREFVSAISPIFRNTKFSGVKDDKIDKRSIRVSFFGEPVFYPDGSTAFK